MKKIIVLGVLSLFFVNASAMDDEPWKEGGRRNAVDSGALAAALAAAGVQQSLDDAYAFQREGDGLISRPSTAVSRQRRPRASSLVSDVEQVELREAMAELRKEALAGGLAAELDGTNGGAVMSLQEVAALRAELRASGDGDADDDNGSGGGGLAAMLAQAEEEQDPHVREAFLRRLEGLPVASDDGEAAGDGEGAPELALLSIQERLANGGRRPSFDQTNAPGSASSGGSETRARSMKRRSSSLTEMLRGRRHSGVLADMSSRHRDAEGHRTTIELHLERKRADSVDGSGLRGQGGSSSSGDDGEYSESGE